ncbi:MAG: hypothetical protein ABI411_01475 [Tahibacter sp.]
MSDRSHPDELSTDLALRNALRELPLVSPDSSVWSSLREQLSAQKIIVDKSFDFRRRAWAVALAAGVLLAVVSIPSLSPIRDPARIVEATPLKPTVTATPVSALAGLRGESQRIESWLRQLSAGGATLSGQDLMAAAEIEDLIGMVDLQLAATATDDVDSASLWKQRVELLHDLAAIRATNYSLAISDVDANGSSPTLRNWIN